MILADTNLMVPLFVPSQTSAQCAELIRRDADWHLPDWWQIEFANVMRTLHRAGRIDPAEAEKALAGAIHLLPSENTHPVDLVATLRIACAAGISAYDARFIALARSFGQKLVTEDTRLRTACPEDTLSIDDALRLFP